VSAATKVKHPVIPSQQSQQDAVTALNNLRSYFKQAADNGGLVTKQDLVDAKLVNNGLVKPATATPATPVTPTVTLGELFNLPALPEDGQVYILVSRSGSWSIEKLPMS
jgi:hypothetical protein